MIPILDLAKRAKKAVLLASARGQDKMKIPLYLSSIPGHGVSCFLGAIQIPFSSGVVGHLERPTRLQVILTLTDDLEIRYSPEGAESMGRAVISAHQLREAKALLIWKRNNVDSDFSIQWEED